MESSRRRKRRRRSGASNWEMLLPVPKRLRGPESNEDVEPGLGKRKLSHDDYTIGWLCALSIEMAAAKGMMDKIHESLSSRPNDSNAYILGNIGLHNIAIACLPAGRYGTNGAAVVAMNMHRSFPSIQFTMMVGIGGGIPRKVDIRLGDVVVGKSVVQFDFGKTVRGGMFHRTGTLNGPPQALMTAVAKLRADHESQPSKIPTILDNMLDMYPSMTKYRYPEALNDQLFDSAYDHVEAMDTCAQCDTSKLLQRPNRMEILNKPKIHYGNIASGNQVMKHGPTRDRLAQELDILCFEMEAAGIMDNFPCLVVRGICDYADSHKNKKWQEYAAATAAAYAKELLCEVPANIMIRNLRAANQALDSTRHAHRDDPCGGNARGGDACGGNASGGNSYGGNARGGDASGGNASGGDARGGDASSDWRNFLK